MYINVNQAAILLGLNPQTVYRKVKRGEIPHVRFGSTLRFKKSELEKSLLDRDPVVKQSAKALPSFLAPLFWDSAFAKITSEKDVVMERVLEMGDLPAVRWLLENGNLDSIKIFLRGKGKRRLSIKNLKFWNYIFDMEEDGFKNIAGNTKTSLGETRWY